MTSDFSARFRRYQDALYEALAGASTTISDADPLRLLAALVQRCRSLEVEAENATEALDALAGVGTNANLEAALSDAATRFESPQRFREALYFARCLERDAAAALALLSARGYLESAVVPAAQYPDLAGEQAALVDATTFATLWSDPERQAGFVSRIDSWKQAYLPRYVERHGLFNAALAEIGLQTEALQSQVAALERLNGLQRLGPPQALAALARFHEIEAVFACPADAEALSNVLPGRPICPYCGFRLGEKPPDAEELDAKQEIEGGLARQQARLAQRLADRSPSPAVDVDSEPYQRLIAALQANELPSLDALLDDGLMAALRELLESPEPVARLVDRLADAFYEIDAANLEDAIAEFRQLLQEELRRGNGRLRIRRDAGE